MSFLLNTVSIAILRMVASEAIITMETTKFVPGKTGEVNKFVKFCIELNDVEKLPPKYLNKSIFAKTLYLNHVAPFDTNVTTMFAMYIPVAIQTEAM